MTYEPTFASVSGHPVPDWFHNAKLGIFIHWGLYSVPAYAPNAGELSEYIANGEWEKWFANNPYAEWYMNSYRIDDSPTQRYHRETYGANVDYKDFVPRFNEAIQAWQPEEWAALFKQVNARYVVLTTKHHDGFLMWPSETPNPHIPGYHATRNLVGELGDAVRNVGLRMAYYYSGGIDWTFNPQVVRHITDLQKAVPQMPAYVDYANAHWRELTDRYGTNILWNDIAYPKAADLNALFADYYNKMPEGVINNRFTQEFRMDDVGIVSDAHFDFETPEYTSFSEIREKKWESCRGIGASFGYNQIEGPEQYQSVETLVRSLVDIVSKNGNLLLNIGPMADGTIPAMQRERLLGLGAWLDVNGEAIFDTRPWHTAEGKTGDDIDVRFTQKGDTLYATLLNTPTEHTVLLRGLRTTEGTTVRVLNDTAATWQQTEEGVMIQLNTALPVDPAHVVAIAPQPKLF
ncbi:MAG: alpha-L-fucosidase [Caldilineaceae bacterium]|nr:alpha-L-fucosidase [Caldilineaceae bacterium]